MTGPVDPTSPAAPAYLALGDSYTSAPLDLEPFAQVRRWREAFAARPATQRAYALAQQVNPAAGKPLSDEEKKILFGQGPR